MTEIDTARVLRIATEARAFLEPRWEEWRRDHGRARPDGTSVSHDMCRFTTCFLKQALEREMPEGEWQWVGGTPDDEDGDLNREYGTPGGFCDRRTNTWHGHYWVTDGGFDLIVDITADQFGGPVVWVGHDVEWHTSEQRIARATHRDNYDEEAVDERMRDVSFRVSSWLRDWEDGHAPGWSGDVRPAPAAPVR